MLPLWRSGSLLRRYVTPRRLFKASSGKQAHQCRHYAHYTPSLLRIKADASSTSNLGCGRPLGGRHRTWMLPTITWSSSESTNAFPPCIDEDLISNVLNLIMFSRCSSKRGGRCIDGSSGQGSPAAIRVSGHLLVAVRETAPPNQLTLATFSLSCYITQVDALLRMPRRIGVPGWTRPLACSQLRQAGHECLRHAARATVIRVPTHESGQEVLFVGSRPDSSHPGPPRCAFAPVNAPSGMPSSHRMVEAMPPLVVNKEPTYLAPPRVKMMEIRQLHTSGSRSFGRRAGGGGKGGGRRRRFGVKPGYVLQELATIQVTLARHLSIWVQTRGCR